MTILSRYILRQAAGAVLMILLSLTAVTWIAVALRQLEVMTSQGQDALIFLKITSLAIPSLLAFVAPLAALLASLQVLSRLNGDSELIVMTAGGASTWRIVRPLLLLAAIVSAGVAFVNHIASPWSQKLLREYIIQARTRLISQVLLPGRFASPEPNMTVHIRDRGPDGALLGLLMHDKRDPKAVSSYLAEKGYIVRQGDSAFLLMQNGHVFRTPESGAAESITFDRYAVDLNRYEAKSDQGTALRPRERYTGELIRPDPKDPVYQAQPARFKSELHDRLANPLYPIAFVLLAIAFVGQAATTRQNRVQAIIIGFAVAIGFRLLGIAAANAAAVRPSAIWMLYAVPGAAIVLALVMINQNMIPRRGFKRRTTDETITAGKSRSIGALFARKPKSPASAARA
jgi:lipopolysaccharide export system permease protein